MTFVDYSSGPAGQVIDGNRDAYTRILNWEAAITRRRGTSRMARNRNNWLYYSGEVLPPGQTSQPLEINYLRATCEAHASYLWGQWEPQGSLITWAVRPRRGKGDKEVMETLGLWANLRLRCGRIHAIHQAESSLTVRRYSQLCDTTVEPLGSSVECR